MQRLARVSTHSAAGGASLSRDGGVGGCREPQGSSSMLWRCVAQVCGQVSRSAVEAGATRRKLGLCRFSRKTPDSEINEEFTSSL